MFANTTSKHRLAIVPGERFRRLLEFIDLLAGLNVGILLVVDESNSTCEVLDCSVILIVLTVDKEEDVGVVVNRGFDVDGASLQNAVKKYVFETHFLSLLLSITHQFYSTPYHIDTD